MSEKYRIYFWDNLKLLLIFFVVMGHVIDMSNYPSDLIKFIYFFIYFFHMPVFIFVMGYFSKNVDACAESAFVKYFLPYCLLVVLSFVQLKFTVVDEETLSIFRLFSPASSCWFLLASFVWKKMLPDLLKIKHVVFFTLLLGLLSGFSHEFGYKFALGRLCVFTVYFLLGYFTTDMHIDRIRKVPKVYSFIVVIILMGLIYYLAVLKNMPREAVLCRTYYTDGNEINEFIYRIVFYIISSIMILILINLAPNKKYRFTYLGSKTLYVYFFHMFIVRFIEKYMVNVTIFKEYELVYLLFVVIMSVLITLGLSNKLVEKIYCSIISLLTGILIKRKDL